MRYSFAKLLIFGIFSNYVLTSSINDRDQNDIETNAIEDSNESLNFDEKIDEVLGIDENDDTDDNNDNNNINTYDNSTSVIDPPYNNKPIQSILIQLANSDIYSVEKLDKIAKDLAAIHGLPDPVRIGQLKGYYKFNISGGIRSSLQKRRIKRHIKRLHDNEEIVTWVDLDRTVSHSKRSITLSDFKDPLAHSQWNIFGRNDKTINVLKVWDQGITGKGVRVCVVDDGLNYLHPDVKNNYYAAGSYDFNSHSNDPIPKKNDDHHGTRCAGEIAAGKNDYCGVGVAYDAQVSGVRILSGTLSVSDEAASLNYDYHNNHIYSCSWGPTDDGKTVEEPSGITKRAFINGVTNGRNGKGSIFVFATGNGALKGDNCNFDGYTNSIYTITVGAITHEDKKSAYSEECSAQLAVTYSSGSGKYISTTDTSMSNLSSPVCTSSHGGTSAAAPIAAGIFALVLSVRPDLHWRDLQYLVMETATPIDHGDSDWKYLPSGRLYNHKYGYGKLDAYKIVERAKTWELVNEATSFTTDKQFENDIIDILESKIYVSEKSVRNFRNVEQITVTVDIEHQCRGEIQVELISPNNVVSLLATRRVNDCSSEGLRNWTFMTVKHWDENPVGYWTLRVTDKVKNNKYGRLYSWYMTIYGQSYNKSGKKGNKNLGNFKRDTILEEEEKPIIEEEKPIIEEEKPIIEEEKPIIEEEKPIIEEEKPVIEEETAQENEEYAEIVSHDKREVFKNVISQYKSQLFILSVLFFSVACFYSVIYVRRLRIKNTIDDSILANNVSQLTSYLTI
ncbi:hypothetical protein H8356DRAFT_951657 [Neocallimastix lanati (nom. inval.)]|jgi:subtilisin-like proprotein convertase family protein|uniref:P/Homo B domain-containing protein n=1 Tax=Neocallimastix californiae TaxID=1754190 RepID=A0A1Y1ZI96_9FUNG|nr:hypothetical protein H8356DRAFT_951657 [Neocallimastix sp. JGI-2020a]ORY09555.1 hypothetical protein LY90DRAFT_201102 [Neocallimastix californiae]|eukprot:ORY09555.1 hypothetical protein LY90DRAFT_201102 [Neocallimastix californiae]